MSDGPVVDTLQIVISDKTVLRLLATERPTASFLAAEDMIARLLVDALEVKTSEVTMGGVMEALLEQRNFHNWSRWYDDARMEHIFTFYSERSGP